MPTPLLRPVGPPPLAITTPCQSRRFDNHDGYKMAYVILQVQERRDRRSFWSDAAQITRETGNIQEEDRGALPGRPDRL
jgi:hypothetical protein